MDDRITAALANGRAAAVTAEAALLPRLVVYCPQGHLDFCRESIDRWVRDPREPLLLPDEGVELVVLDEGGEVWNRILSTPARDED
jgi:hypothetical protein